VAVKSLKLFLDAAVPFPVRLAQNLRILSEKLGQRRSIGDGRPVDSEGMSIPWYTYPMIEFLRQFDLTACSVFEFGAGNSSQFWANRTKRVVSVESDPRWFDSLKGNIRPNQTLILQTEKEKYAHSIVEQGEFFDIIVIDGLWRYACATQARPLLAPGGLLILDNSDWHPNTARFLRETQLFQVDFSGFGPINAYTWTTSIFLSADTRLQGQYRNPSPIGGIEQVADDDQ